MDYILTVEGERYMARVNAQMMPMHLIRVDVGSGIVAQPELLTSLTEKSRQFRSIPSSRMAIQQLSIVCLPIWNCI